MAQPLYPVVFVGAGNITFGNDNVKWNHSLRVERCLGAALEVVAVVDPSVERVQQVLEQKKSSAAASCYSHASHYTTLNEAAERLKSRGIRPRLIILGVPPQFRGTILPGRNLEQQVIAAFGSEPSIFCEKPVSTALPYKSLPVVDLLHEAGNKISVGYMLRYLQVVQKAKEIIERDNLQVMSIFARYTCAYSKIRKSDWWDKSKQCGPIVEQGTHFCDLMRYLGGDVELDTVFAYALEHYEPAGKLSHMAVDESLIPEEKRIPRATSAIWKFTNGAIGSLTHLVALHDIKYSNEIVVTADGYQLRLTDLYSTPALHVHTPVSEEEITTIVTDDDPFLAEFAALLGLDTTKPLEPAKTNILSSYEDAYKTYELTWKIRTASEKSSDALKQKNN
ncbi:putative oxidoreductase C terminal-domain-containing protein [Xylaria arbuscula]|nr:putative oxidoreductase C terminal-domain-containing protein [Xylaria arbuscula]